MEKKLQNIALVIFVIICFTPAFYLKYTVFPFIVAKTLLFRLLICLLAINWTALVAINPQKYLSIFNKKNYIL
ncbi:MAG: hypothetical protein PHO23_01605 [Candidatus Pacebacteria bacterium]|nr:hypothetical protein [Candidatus Paceibacterota bacterium]